MKKFAKNRQNVEMFGQPSNEQGRGASSQLKMKNQGDIIYGCPKNGVSKNIGMLWKPQET